MAEDSDQGEKTEDPSEHRIEEFRRKGEVASSKELNSVLILTGTLVVLVLSSLFMYEILAEYIEWLYALDIKKVYSKEMLADIIARTAFAGGKCIAPVFATSLCLGFLAQVAQVGFLFAPEVLELKLDRINPLNGAKRLFSKKALFDALKGIFKFAVILSITYFIVKDELYRFTGLIHSELPQTVEFGQLMVLKLVLAIILGLAIIAVVDFFWEKHTYKQKLMMTKEEAKRESKEKDGNPEVKQKIKAIQREMSRKRMMESIKTADVVITNPTHISIVIKYDLKTMIAPAVVAKGADHLAFKIRELAKEHDIPIVENVPLARALYKTVKVGQGIPQSMYKAVAEVIGFVYRLRKKRYNNQKRA
jgi:flagellar biosynthetic protein FlhB